MRTSWIKPPSVAPLHRLPALWLALLLAAGIQLDNLFDPNLAVAATFWLALILLLAAASQKYSGMGRVQHYTACAAILLTGNLVSCLFDQTLELKRQFVDSSIGQVAVQGWVCGPARRTGSRFGQSGQLEFELDVTAEKRAGDNSWQQASYRLNVAVDDPGELIVKGGNRLALAAELLPVDGYANPGGFDWREYWGRRFVAGKALAASGGHVRLLPGNRLPGVRALAAGLQARLLELHDQLYPDPLVRAVAGAILLGDRRGLDNSTRSWFSRSGTIHVLVVSGLHLSFIAGVVYLLFSLVLGRDYAGAAATSLVLLVYALATGGRPPVVRAWLLVTFAMFALPAGRTRVLLNSLAAAFAVLLLVNPSWLLDPGFQLSFAAVAGIGLVLPYVEARFSRRDWWSSGFKRWAFRLAAVSVAAQLAVAPLLARHFGTFSLAAFAANPPVVALAGFCVTGGFAADIAGLAWLPAGKFLAFWVSLLIEAMLAVARWFAAFEWSSVSIGSPGVTGVMFCWVMLLLAAGLVHGERRNLGRLALVLLLWLNVSLWQPLIISLRQRTEITFLDLGEATAPVVRFPGGEILLADQAGRSGRGNWVAGELIGPFLYHDCGGRLDYLLLRGRATWSWTSRIIRQFKPRVVIVSGNSLPGETTSRLGEYCRRRGVALRQATQNDTLECGGAKLIFIEQDGPPEIEYKGSRVLLAGGVPPGPGAIILDRYAVVEVANEPQNGVSGPWLVMPAAGANGSERLIATSRSGAVKIVLNQGGVRVATERDGRRGG